MYEKQELKPGDVLDQDYLNSMDSNLDPVSQHRQSKLCSAFGSHDLRYQNGILQVKVEDNWVDIMADHPVYGVSIDLSNSNPETCVTYIDDAVGMIPGTDWLDKPIFNTIRPCLFKEGKVVGYLNPNNFAQFEDGTEADITSGEAGDVMIEIPKIGYRINKSDNTLTVQITSDPAKEGFSYLAHTREVEGDRDFLYIGAFLGSLSGNTLRSLSEIGPLNWTTLTDFRTYAQANGSGYDLLAFYPVTLLQCLYLVMYKDLNSQAALGMGYVGDFDYYYCAKATGATVRKGMCYGSQDSMEQMKFLGVEDLWGNLSQWLEGLVTSEVSSLLVATTAFNDTGSGYTELEHSVPLQVSGYLSAPLGTNDTGFISEEAEGSSSTHFADYVYLRAGAAPSFGYDFTCYDLTGAFALYLDQDPAVGDISIGGRLMYL